MPGGGVGRLAAAAMDRAAVAKMGAVASASLCALVGGVVLAQYIFTMKKKTGRKTKIIEMVRGKGPRARPRGEGRKDGGWLAAALGGVGAGSVNRASAGLGALIGRLPGTG